MRVLLLNTNRLKVPQPVIPLGLCQVAEATQTTGHDVRLLDLCFDRDPIEAARLAVRDFDPDTVGISVRNLDNCDSQTQDTYLQDVRELVTAIRRDTPAHVVLGGPAVSIAPEPVLDYVGADSAVVGEGEKSFPELLEHLDRAQPVWRADKSGLSAPSSLPVKMLRNLPLRRYAAHGTPAPIQTRRGCSLGCVYCTYPAIEGTTYRLKPAGAVAEEILEAQSLGVLRSAEFVDSTFNYPVDHAFRVCEELERLRVRTPLHTTGINPLGASTELFRLMERAGFEGISISLESASDEVLQGLGKGYTSHDVAETVRAARMTSMARLWVFMFGGPNETERTVNETLDFIRRYLDGRDLVLLTCGIRIYPGTKLEEIARREGVLTGAEDLLQPVFYFSPGIGRERLLEILSGAGLCSGTTILARDMSWPALTLLNRLLSVLRLKQPYWRYARPVMTVRHAIGGVKTLK